MSMMLILLFFLPVYISPSQSVETRSHVERHFLNDDGSLNGSSVTPDCGNGLVINFIEYRYQERKCHFSDVCQVEHEEKFSPAAEFQLHKMCSGKTKCDNLSFPNRSSEQKERTNSVYLEYSCLDQARTFINMCNTTVTYFSDTVYVTFYNTAQLFEKCQCFVNMDMFSLAVTDLRLTTGKDQCSSTEVIINFNKFVCDSKKENFGSVFHRQLIRSDVNAYIFVSSNSSVSPDRILISLTPKVSAKITCEGTERRSPSTQNAKQQTSKQKSYTDRSNSQSQGITSVAQPSPTANYSTDLTENILSHPETCMNCTPLAVGIGIAIVILAIAFAFPEKIQSLKNKFLRFLDWIRNCNANQVPCSDDDLSAPVGISVNGSGKLPKEYPSNTKNSIENNAMLNKSDTDHGKIQSPQEENETNFISLKFPCCTSAC